MSIASLLPASFPHLAMLENACDALGPYAILVLPIDPVEAKKRCIALETSHPAARLIDLDVYSAAGAQIDRASLGVAARSCLVCPSAAVDCIRLKRHSPDEVIARIHELLRPFAA